MYARFCESRCEPSQGVLGASCALRPSGVDHRRTLVRFSGSNVVVEEKDSDEDPRLKAVRENLALVQKQTEETKSKAFSEFEQLTEASAGVLNKLRATQDLQSYDRGSGKLLQEALVKAQESELDARTEKGEAERKVAAQGALETQLVRKKIASRVRALTRFELQKAAVEAAVEARNDDEKRKKKRRIESI